MFGLFAKKLSHLHKTFGTLVYKDKMEAYESEIKLSKNKEIRIYLNNITEENFVEKVAVFEKYYIGLIKRIDSISQTILAKVNLEEKLDMKVIRPIAIQLYYQENSTNSEITFEEVGSNDLGGHLIITSIDKDFKVSDDYGIEG